MSKKGGINIDERTSEKSKIKSTQTSDVAPVTVTGYWYAHS